MKKIIFVVLLLTLGIFVSKAQVRTAKIEFTKTIHDFGTIKEADGKVHYKFEFTNVGVVPLIISSVDASCGCTTPSWTKMPILPGKKGFVDAEFNPANYQSFDKSITVSTNGKPQSVVLRIKGNVIPKEKSMTDIFAFEIGKLRVKGKNVAFSVVKGNKTINFEFYNDNSVPVTLSFNNLPDYVIVKPSITKVQSRKVAQFSFTINSASATKGFHRDLIDLTIDGKSYPKALKIVASVR